MPRDPSPRQTPDPFAGDQTLFFQRRSSRVRLLPLAVVCILVLGSGALIVWAINRVGHKSVDDLAHTKVDPFAGRPFIPSSDPLATNNPPAPTPIKPVASAIPVNVAPATAVTPPPGNDAPLNFNVDDPDNAQVRAEVLRRIDLMPGVSSLNKDKLYASVDHARGMGRVLTIPFEKGDSAVRAGDVDRLKQQLATPQIKKLVDDPTVVFVVLGYADQKGNEKINVEISQNRARSVLETLRDKCGFQNVMHAVAMGGSNLFSAQHTEKNRVVEIWAVLP